MIGVHSHIRAAIFPTLLSLERYKWLHETHSRLHNNTDFPHDLLRLMSRYHPKAISLKSQGRSIKLANHWAIPSRLRHSIESTFLKVTELFGSPLKWPISHGITYCSAFPEDKVFGAIINSFQFRWTGSCIANPEYEPKNMLKVVLHALASFKNSKTPFIVVLALSAWDDIS